MKYVIGNWKMAPETWGNAEALFKQLIDETESVGGVTIVVCPPLVYLQPSGSLLPTDTAFTLGAQDVYFESAEAHTGEVSVAQLADLGVTHVILGHSERRALGEDNMLIAKKTQAVIAGGMVTVLCVGESSRDGDWHAFLIEEVTSALDLLTDADLEKLVIAYEPIWAVGADEPDTPKGAQASALLIRKVVRERFGEEAAAGVPVLYGGSVNAETIGPFAAADGLDGVLVGRASRTAVNFAKIVAAYRL